MEKQAISECSKIGENGETGHVSVSTEESHEATILGIYNKRSLWK